MVMIIQADSLNTGNQRRDKHLQSAAFFDIENYPVVRFRSAGVTDGSDGRLVVNGELEAAGGSTRLQLDVTVEHDGDRPEFVSLDGVMEAPGGEPGFKYPGWTFEFDRGEDGNQFKLEETNSPRPPDRPTHL